MKKITKTQYNRLKVLKSIYERLQEKQDKIYYSVLGIIGEDPHNWIVDCFDNNFVSLDVLLERLDIKVEEK
jgi:hypothetical protein